jgi:methionyl aminopeptidase
MISIKSNTEIDKMRRSGEILALAYEKLSNEIKPGITTLEMDKIVEDFIRGRGAAPSFKGYKGHPGVARYPASICASINNEVVHGIPGPRTLKNGDIISIDIGVYFNGYHTDAARTFPVGIVTEEAGMLIEVTRESFYVGIKQAVKGKRIVDISAAIQDHVELKGFSVVRDYVGHGIGREMHEAPQIPNYKTREKGPRIEAGMTFAIEPMVNAGGHGIILMDNGWTVVTEDGSLSAHYENTVVVTEKEPLILTKLN